MSETKHTPTAGATRAAKALHLAGYTSFAGESAEVRIAEIIDREAGGWINQAARPKVEELVRLVTTWDSLIVGGAHGDWKELAAKAREVEAALGGKAE
jgi:hypothetical protein